ncbi:MAG TPA: type II toxin-antitoxin system RelE/ParE family toxin [Roseiarcus sp.]|nr:type II toxin-antitoxin system RelE/ParE family toxin [Roseiarcus sp.]
MRYKIHAWPVAFHPTFLAEFDKLEESVQDELLAMTELLKVAGPWMKRPGADTLTGSKHANMKELRFDAAGGVWRVAYAFDPARKAILLVAGDKSGVSQKRFYRGLIAKADQRFDEHLAALRTTREAK